jgi:CRISPR type IV-associated DEAD/DEAH-box helicase Csf4
MANIRLSLPASMYERLTREFAPEPGPAASAALRFALKERMDPVVTGLDDQPQHSEVRYLNPHDAALLDAAGRRHPGHAPARLAAGMIAAAIAARSKKDHVEPQDSVLSAVLAEHGLARRPEQAAMTEALISLGQTTSILFVEAGTGTGKSLAMVVAARELLELEADAIVVIAAPTFTILRHLEREWLRVGDVVDLPPHVLLAGRGEFIDVTHTTELLADLEGDRAAALRAWLAAGGHPAHEHRGRYLVEDAARIAADIQTEPLTSATDGTDPGVAAFREQFARAREARLVFCTQAMLAVDVRLRMLRAAKHLDDDQRAELKALRASMQDLYHRNRAGDAEARGELRERLQAGAANKGGENAILLGAEDDDARMLPPFRYLMVDEAHQLEAVFSNVLSRRLSVFSLQHEAKRLHDKKQVSCTLAVQLRNLFEALGEMSLAGDELDLLSDTPTAIAARAAVLVASEAMTRAKRGASLWPRSFVHLRDSLIAVARDLRDPPRGARILLQPSAVRGYPRLSAGRDTVGKELDFLWRGIRSGAVVSATLFTRNRLGEDSARLMAELLAVPAVRQRIVRPMSPAWLTANVTVHLPAPARRDDGSHWLTPVGRSAKFDDEAAREAARARWLTEMSSVIDRAAKDARGGMLVLCTSYQDIAGIAERLASHGDRVLPHPRGVAFDGVKRAFLDRALVGDRPIWLSTGPAWTGLDLRPPPDIEAAVPPESDCILTDVVVTRIPSGTNDTLTHRRRLQRANGFAYEVLESALKFKQGIGRLMRREGVTDRHLWVLDGRLNSASDELRPQVERILASYRLRQTFAP